MKIEDIAMVLGIVAFIVSVFAVAYVYNMGNQDVDLSDVNANINANILAISGLELSISNFESNVFDLKDEIKDIDTDSECYCDIDEDDFNDLEDDINDLEDDVDDLEYGLVEECFVDTVNWTDFRGCISNNF